jgi:hypothetical protein
VHASGSERAGLGQAAVHRTGNGQQQERLLLISVSIWGEALLRMEWNETGDQNDIQAKQSRKSREQAIISLIIA